MNPNKGNQQLGKPSGLIPFLIHHMNQGSPMLEVGQKTAPFASKMPALAFEHHHFAQMLLFCFSSFSPQESFPSSHNCLCVLFLVRCSRGPNPLRLISHPSRRQVSGPSPAAWQATAYRASHRAGLKAEGCRSDRGGLGGSDGSADGSVRRSRSRWNPAVFCFLRWNDINKKNEVA